MGVQIWLDGEDRAELQAIARTAKHRLERGIWTSPGGGAAQHSVASLIQELPVGALQVQV